MNSAIYGDAPKRRLGTEFDNRWVAMGVHWSRVHWAYGFQPDPDAPDPRDPDPDEAPETPLDEPRPPRVQDPPPQNEQKGPYTVRTHWSSTDGGLW
jgi:hypothetical protein